jgi:hypothetical protein
VRVRVGVADCTRGQAEAGQDSFSFGRWWRFLQADSGDAA